MNAEFKKFNVRGRVTYSQFTMDQAIAAEKNSKFPVQPDKIAPKVQLLLTDSEVEKFIKHMKEVYLPEAIAREAAGEEKDAFNEKMAAKIEAALDAGIADNWPGESPHLPIKKVYEKTQELVPDAVGTISFTGPSGSDMELLARVTSEDQFKVPPTEGFTKAVLAPIEQTVHSLYPGAYAFATLTLHGWMVSAGNLGVSAYANAVVFLEDRERLGGGIALDEDDVFMDE